MPKHYVDVSEDVRLDTFDSSDSHAESEPASSEDKPVLVSDSSTLEEVDIVTEFNTVDEAHEYSPEPESSPEPEYTPQTLESYQARLEEAKKKHKRLINAKNSLLDEERALDKDIKRYKGMLLSTEEGTTSHKDFKSTLTRLSGEHLKVSNARLKAFKQQTRAGAHKEHLGARVTALKSAASKKKKVLDDQKAAAKASQAKANDAASSREKMDKRLALLPPEVAAAIRPAVEAANAPGAMGNSYSAGKAACKMPVMSSVGMRQPGSLLPSTGYDDVAARTLEIGSTVGTSASVQHVTLASAAAQRQQLMASLIHKPAARGMAAARPGPPSAPEQIGNPAAGLQQKMQVAASLAEMFGCTQKHALQLLVSGLSEAQVVQALLNGSAAEATPTPAPLRYDQGFIPSSFNIPQFGYRHTSDVSAGFGTASQPINLTSMGPVSAQPSFRHGGSCADLQPATGFGLHGASAVPPDIAFFSDGSRYAVPLPGFASAAGASRLGQVHIPGISEARNTVDSLHGMPERASPCMSAVDEDITGYVDLYANTHFLLGDATDI